MSYVTLGMFLFFKTLFAHLQNGEGLEKWEEEGGAEGRGENREEWRERKERIEKERRREERTVKEP